MSAVSKYGIFRWHKVSSLLNKSPEECSKRFRMILSDNRFCNPEEILTLYKKFPSQYCVISEQTGIEPEICYQLIRMHVNGKEENEEWEKSKEIPDFDVDRQLCREIARERVNWEYKRKALKNKKKKTKKIQFIE